jgi:beta-glucosidase
VTLDPGASRRVTVTLDPEALSYWDTAAHARVTPAGPVRVVVGRSADSAALRGRIVLR